MAYNKSKIYEESIELSKRMGFFFIQDIIDYLACGRTTFYTFFPDESDELNILKDNLFKNRITQKIHLRKRLSEGSGSELIALYKLIGNDEERKALSTNWNNNEHSGEIKTKTETNVHFSYGDFNDDVYSDDDI
jgi:hypothetical protein